MHHIILLHAFSHIRALCEFFDTCLSAMIKGFFDYIYKIQYTCICAHYLKNERLFSSVQYACNSSSIIVAVVLQICSICCQQQKQYVYDILLLLRIVFILVMVKICCRKYGINKTDYIFAQSYKFSTMCLQLNFFPIAFRMV